MGLVNCKFKEIEISTTDGKDCNAYALPKYYLDVKVVDPDGAPVAGAKVTVAINTEIGVPASTGWKYSRYNPQSAIPRGCDLETVWADAEFSPENMEVLRPPPTGKYDNFYLHYRFITGRKKDSTTTGKDGHTPLPKDAANTMILTDFVQDSSGKKEFTYTITVEKDGIKKMITGVNPGPEWYCPDPNKPTYTITAVPDGKTVTEAQLKK
ncbi:MAG: carboxypeptidase-like regulatory domain-containing protein [Planctomycetota bacterium]|nr:carboxypeptidase-like regulatory domain-containing protein [Planctomycetota bacterium]